MTDAVVEPLEPDPFDNPVVTSPQVDTASAVVQDTPSSDSERIDAIFAWIANGQVWPENYSPEGKKLTDE